MNLMLKKIKDKLFYLAVEKNQYILYEYQQYRWNNEQLHKKFRPISWLILIGLNVKYRIFKVNSNKKKNTYNYNVKKIDVAQESTFLKRERPEALAKKLLKYDVISFDVFDTLLFRPFDNPDDLFYLLGIENGIANFKGLRVKSEREARELTIKPGREINIYDIYDIIEKKSIINKEDGIIAEFELEKKMCRANPYMQRVFEILKANNKTIVATSDMYLPKELMKELLISCGYNGFEDIFVSCDYGCSKGSKMLQQVVSNTVGKNKSIIHIGDNFFADVKMSKEYGWDAIHYPKVGEVTKVYRNDNMTSIVGSIYKGIVSSYFHNGLKNFNPYYEHGFIYGGLLALGFSQWLNKYVKNNNIDKVLFLARDGYLLQEIYEEYYKNADTDYVLWSRFSSQQLAFNGYTEDYIDKNIKERINYGLKIKELLKVTDLKILEHELDKYDLKLEDDFTIDNYENIRIMIYENKEKISMYFNKSLEASKEYFKSIIKKNKKICAVDIGWRGTGLAYIKYVLEKELKLDIDVKGVMVGAIDMEFGKEMFARGDFNAYLFSEYKNRELLSKHKQNLVIANMFVELLFTAPAPSFIKFDKDKKGSVDFVFSSPELYNYDIINEIHKGIKDFAKIYTEILGEYKDKIEITPQDAYAPIEVLLDNPKVVYELFKEYEFNSLAGLFDSSEITTLGEIMKDKGVI